MRLAFAKRGRCEVLEVFGGAHHQPDATACCNYHGSKRYPDSRLGFAARHHSLCLFGGDDLTVAQNLQLDMTQHREKARTFCENTLQSATHMASC